MAYRTKHRKAGAFGGPKATDWTPERIAKALEGYDEVPEDRWEMIPRSTFIRLEKTDGKFLGGGFVRGHAVDEKKRPLIQMETDNGRKQWTHLHKDIAKIWMKHDATLVTVPGLLTVVDDVKDNLVAVDARIATVEKNLERLTKLLAQIVRRMDNEDARGQKAT